jgi:uncharacterized protein (DUF885 family)
MWWMVIAACTPRNRGPVEATVEAPPTDPATVGVHDPALRDLLAEHWSSTMERYPEWATTLGEHRYDDRVMDRSLSALQAWRQKQAGWVERLGSIEPERPEDRVTRDLLLGSLRSDLGRESCHFELWSVSARSNALVDSNRLAEDAVVETEQDAKELISRYRALAEAIGVESENLRAGVAAGLVENHDSVTKVIAMLQAELGAPLDSSPMLAPSHAPSFQVLHGDPPRSLRDELRAVVEQQIRPALGRYRDTLQEVVLPAARSRDQIGLYALPGGEDCYRALVLEHTTLERSPDELHEVGLQELERIHAEFRELGARALQTEDLGAIFARLREDPELHFTTPAEIRAAADAALRRAESAVPRWFGRIPQAPCTVDVVPDYLAPYTTIAYYDPVRPSGRKFGVYYVNVSEPSTRPRHEAEVLAFHESVPGHHLQIALAQEQGQLPAFRRFEGSTAFVEGWALYVERLADEMGLYSSDTDRLGMLSFDAWRASRLVVDTGIHAKGWTREQAELFMIENTPLAENNVVNEVDRYITTPGQALAYKTGQLEIRALRAQAEQRLGEHFDVRAFHDVVLDGGAVSLPVLRERIEDWLQGAEGIGSTSTRGDHL